MTSQYKYLNPEKALDFKSLNEKIDESNNDISSQIIDINTNLSNEINNVSETLSRISASTISINDIDDLFTSENIEGALVELYNKVPELPEINIDNAEIERIKQQIKSLTSKQLEILMHLDMLNSSNVDSAGYWIDTLTNDNNILSIINLVLDKDRNRIKGANGEVTFKKIELPFVCDGFEYTHDVDDNFIESIVTNKISSGQNKIVLDKFSYEIK